MEQEVFPSIFVSHGAPTLALEDNAAHRFLGKLGAQLGRPRAVLCVSAHWQEPVATVGTTAQPETIHDFGGFPAELYRLRYPAPGAPEVAEQAARLLAEAGLRVGVSATRGLDHGAWVPLMLMYPEADVPVAQLSLQFRAGPAEHLALGRALAGLRQSGVLVLGSGSAVHNLRRVDFTQSSVADWAVAFDQWLAERITAGAVDELLDYRRRAPSATLAHPTEEHLLPLFVAWGAAHPASTGRILHNSFTFGSLSMAAYAFG